MKPIYPFAFLGALFAVGALNAATTTPVGYVTQVLPPSQFTLAGLTLHSPAIATGVLESATANSVTDEDFDFAAVLTAESTYILELENGTIQEVGTWSGNSLTTPEDISGQVTGGATKYVLRKAPTVSEVFGATNSVGLTSTPDGDPSVADKILIPNSAGGFDTVFYFNDGDGTEGWLDGDGNLAADKPLVYADGFYVQRVAGAPLNLVITGEVKTKPTSGALVTGFNYLNSVAPVGLTLAESGLKNFISHSADGDSSTVDNVLIPTPSGGYTTAFYFNDGDVEGWLDGEGNLADEYALEDGFLILNRGGVKPYTVATPESYSSL